MANPYTNRKGQRQGAKTPEKRAAGASSKAPNPTQRRSSQSRIVQGGMPRRTGGGGC